MTISMRRICVAYAGKTAKRMTNSIDNYRKLLDLIMSEGFDTINKLSDEELRKVLSIDE